MIPNTTTKNTITRHAATPTLWRGFIIATAALTLLSGCFISETRNYGGSSGSSSGSSSGGSSSNSGFGKGDTEPYDKRSAAEIERIPDAVPRWEPRSRRGNPKSYVIQGKRYYVMDSAVGYTATGLASWYGQKFHGRQTSSGEPYDVYGMTAAHTSLPLPTYVRVTRLDGGSYAGRSIVVKVNDRGPFLGGRLIDLSYAAAFKLGMIKAGTASVRVEAITFDAASSNTAPTRPIAMRPVTTTVPTIASNRATDDLPIAKTYPMEPDTPTSTQSAATRTVSNTTSRTPASGAPASRTPSARPIQTTRSNTLASGYYIQLGSFRDAERAKQLFSRVNTDNPHKTYIESKTVNGQTLHRVLVGSFTERQDALKWRPYFQQRGYKDALLVKR